MKLKSLLAVLVLTAFAVSCEQSAPTVPDDTVAIPADGPQFAKPNCGVDLTHPSCKDGDGNGGKGGTAKVTLCAKGEVIDQINLIDEDVDPKPWPDIESTGKPCVIPDLPPNDDVSSLEPSGTLTYTTAGPEFEWKFSGTGFVPIDHLYRLIYYRDPWPGTNLICLGEGRANRGGKLRLSGTLDLQMNLHEAKIWIVRKNWVDCDGNGFRWRENPNPGVRRLTNNASDNEDEDWNWPLGPDATWSKFYPYNGALAYDWLFETALIDYTDTND